MVKEIHVVQEVQEVQLSVPIAIIVIRLVEPESGIILNTRLCLLSEVEPLVPKVYILVKEGTSLGLSFWLFLEGTM